MSIEKTRFVEYKPIASLTSGGIINFTIPGSPDEYVKLSESYFVIRAKVWKNAAKEALTDNFSKQVYARQLIAQAVFRQMDTVLQGKLIAGGCDNYAHIARLQIEASYSPAAKQCQLSASEYLSLDERKDLVKNSREFEVAGRLHSAVCMQDRLIPNNVEIKFRFVPNKSEFCLGRLPPPPASNSSTPQDPVIDPVLEILDCTLYIKKILPSSNVILAHATALTVGNMKIDYRRPELKMHTINSSTNSAQFDNVFQGQIPARIMIAMTRHDAFNGNYDSDPFHFGNYGLSSLALYVDNELYDGKPLTMDFANKNYVHAYLSTFNGMGKLFQNFSNGISYKAWGEEGKTIFCFDLTPDQGANDNSHVSLIRNGIVRIEMKFSSNLTNNINVLIYGEYEALLEIDRQRKIITTE